MILKLGFRNVFRHRIRSLVALFSVSFGCIGIIYCGGFFEDIFIEVRENLIHSLTGHIQLTRVGFRELGRSRPFEFLIDNPDEVLDLTRKMPHVVMATPRLHFSGLLSTGDNSVSFVGEGIVPQDDAFVMGKDVEKNRVLRGAGAVIEQGESLSNADPFGINLGRGLADSIGAKVGDNLIMVARTDGGSINAFDVRVRGIFYTGYKQADDYFIRIPLSTAQRLLRTSSVDSIIVNIDLTKNTFDVQKEFKNVIRNKKLGLEVKSWIELSDYYVAVKALFGRIFLVINIVVVFLVVFSIYNTLSLAVSERTNEIGTLMAMGSKRSDIVKLFIVEGMALGAIGGVFGSAIGCAVTWTIAQIGIPMPPPPGLAVEWTARPIVLPFNVCFAMLVTFLASLISSIFPAYRAAKMEIAQCLRSSN